jgi:hypothetical protein
MNRLLDRLLLLVVSIVLVGMLAAVFFGLSGIVIPPEKCTPQITEDELKEGI